MGYTSAQAKEFIMRIAPLMKAEAEARGYRICSTAIAQAIIEGAAGTSKLARDYHNHFGMKAGKAWIKAGKPVVNLKTMEEYTVGTMTQIVDGFRAYKDDAEGVKGYYDFISTSRYERLKTAPTYQSYAEELKKAGYATSSSYVNTLCSTVTKYNLTQYDSIFNVGYYPAYVGSAVQIDEILKAIGVPDEFIGGWEKRKPLAQINGILTYTGSGSQNTFLIALAKSGKLVRI